MTLRNCLSSAYERDMFPTFNTSLWKYENIYEYMYIYVNHFSEYNVIWIRCYQQEENYFLSTNAFNI